MMISKFSALFILLSITLFSLGCQNSGTKSSNPFAQNLRTVPPPATFSSQDAYLGQMPGNYTPQTPATTFQTQGAVPTTQSAVTPATVMPTQGNTNTQATVFAAAEKETDWTPVPMRETSLTAFETMDAKVTNTGGSLAGTSESLIVGASHVVTTIADESLPETLTEPQLLLYSGQ